MSEIILNNYRVTLGQPEAGAVAAAAAASPAMPMVALPPEGQEPSEFAIVQLSKPLDKAGRQAIAEAGVKLNERISDDAYVCQLTDQNIQAVRELAFVQEAIYYPKRIKIDARTYRDESQGPAIPGAAAMAMAAAAPEPMQVDVLLHQGHATSADVASAVAQATGVALEDVEIVTDNQIRLSSTPAGLLALQEIDAVRKVEPVPQNVLWNDVARVMVGATPALTAITADASGQVVCVADTGIDLTNPAFPAARVRNTYNLGRPGLPVDDPNGHGTHVSGSVAGSSTPAGGVLLEGTAPAADLVVQACYMPPIFNPATGQMMDRSLGGLPGNLHHLFNPPYSHDRARIHTNSWGSRNSAGQYTAYCRQVDAFVHDQRDMLILFAAGNDGSDSNGDGVVENGSVCPPGTAKNCLTVGASESLRPAFTAGSARHYRHMTNGWGVSRFPAAPVATDVAADNPEGIAAFSGRGPTSDGRIKPEVVAPGTFIFSAWPSTVAQPSSWVLAEPNFADTRYTYISGTSMATPLVAGCAAQLRELLGRRHNQYAPSAALMKALLINSAHDLRGQYSPSECAATPNFAEGYGRVNLDSVLQAGTDLHLLSNEEHELDTGECRDFMLEVAAGQSLRVTLVWTDPPGDRLQNDLDLTVTDAAGTIRLGNGTPTSNQPDRVNNVEQVTWDNPAAGTVTIRVSAYNITQGNGQDFALVARVF